MIPVSVFIQILNMSFAATWAAVLVIFARFFLRRFSHSYCYALWGVVLFRLVCPASFSSIFSLMPQPQTIPQDIVYAARPQVESGFVFFDEAVSSVLPPATPHASVNPVQIWLEVGNLLWQVGMALLLLYCLVSYLHFLGKLRGAVLIDGKIWESDRIPTAFVLGLFRPKIYLPKGIGEERRFILCHEETHIRRLDNIVKPLALLLLVVHWFNPVLWLAYFLMCRDMEMSCDELALKKLGPDSRKGYSACLLSLSARRSGLAIPLAFGENGVKGRIVNVLRYKRPALLVTVAAVVLAAVLGFCLLTDPDSGWMALSKQEGIPYHDAIWGESVTVERRDVGIATLTDRQQIESLAALISDLEVSRKPDRTQDYEDWELKLAFRRPETSGVGDFTLRFSREKVLCQVEDELYPQYDLRQSEELFRFVERYAFLPDPDQAGSYPVHFYGFFDGGMREVLLDQPEVGTRLAALLLDGTEREEHVGKIPFGIGNYLLINMGGPGAEYYVYEAEGGYYVEKYGDYCLALSEDAYHGIMAVWETVSQLELWEELNLDNSYEGYYTGFQETVNGSPLDQYNSYRPETAVNLAALILSGNEYDLEDFGKDVIQLTDFLRIEIRNPENAYYIYQYENRYFVTKPGDYTSELTQDAYDQIRSIYLSVVNDHEVRTGGGGQSL